MLLQSRCDVCNVAFARASAADSTCTVAHVSRIWRPAEGTLHASLSYPRCSLLTGHDFPSRLCILTRFRLACAPLYPSISAERRTHPHELTTPYASAVAQFAIQTTKQPAGKYTLSSCVANLDEAESDVRTLASRECTERVHSPRICEVCTLPAHAIAFYVLRTSHIWNTCRCTGQDLPCPL